MESLAKQISEQGNNNDLEEMLETISTQKGVCIEVTSGSGDSFIYSTGAMNRGCISSPESKNQKLDFIQSGETKKAYRTINPRLHNQTLLYGVKLNDSFYVFLNTSIDPIDSTITVLMNQLIIVTIVVLLLASIIAYFISRRIAKPIERINQAAKQMANGDMNVTFTSDEDIAEIKELADTLNETKNELAKTEEVRRDLLANVSHDLKTPLTMIKAYAEMVRDLTYKNKKKREENLEVIIGEADRLNGLVNDILDLSKMESKIQELHMTTFSLNELIQTIIHRFEIFSLTENYHFIFEAKNIYEIHADKQKIEQVIYNLMNNAINYTGDDKKVFISLEEYDHNIYVKIRDTGNGIDSKDIKYIWNKYYKSNKKHKRHTVGTGIGLSIVKNIFILHNYEYGVTSEKGKGTTFYFIIKNEKETK